MHLLPPKMTFSQKWHYGFYDPIIDGIKNRVWSILKVLTGTFIVLFSFGFLLGAVPFLAQLIVKIIQMGMNIFS